MQLSVSVRIAEGFLSKEIPVLTLEQVAEIAADERVQTAYLGELYETSKKEEAP